MIKALAMFGGMGPHGDSLLASIKRLDKFAGRDN